jgi:YVTN family beta-propeller protein
MHLLAENAGGDFYHNGGKQWSSQNDPEWQTVKSSVMGETMSSGRHARMTVPEGSDPSHGMAVTADGKTLVVCSRLNNYLYSYSLPDLKLVGSAELGGKGAGWVTLTPDGKSAYVANPVTNDVSVVDVATMKEVARIPVGFVPKRNAVSIHRQDQQADFQPRPGSSVRTGKDDECEGSRQVARLRRAGAGCNHVTQGVFADGRAGALTRR